MPRCRENGRQRSITGGRALSYRPGAMGRAVQIPGKYGEEDHTHTLRGLAILRKHGVVRGHVQSGNLIFSADNLDHLEEYELAQDEAATAIPVQRLDGKPDKRAPRDLYRT